MPYQLNGPEQERIEDLSHTDSLANDIALVRLMVEEARAAGDSKLAAQLLSCIGRLSDSHSKISARTSQVLSKGAVMRLAKQIVELFVEEFAAELAESPERIDPILHKLQTLVGCATNTPQEVRRLENYASGRQHGTAI